MFEFLSMSNIKYKQINWKLNSQFFVQSIITVPGMYLPFVESVENMIFMVNARIVRSTEVSRCSIPRADDTSIFVYTEIRHTAECECGLKILPRRKSAHVAFITVKKSIKNRDSADRVQPALREVIGAYEMRQFSVGDGRCSPKSTSRQLTSVSILK